MARLISPDAIAVVCIWQEARGEPHNGKVGVAEVIRNRTKRKYSSDGTVEGTCLRAYQFSGFLPRDPNLIPSFRIDLTDPVVEECAQAWHTAQEGSDLVHGALLYANLEIVSPDWVKLCTKVAKIGRHTFFVPPVKKITPPVLLT